MPKIEKVLLAVVFLAALGLTVYSFTIPVGDSRESYASFVNSVLNVLILWRVLEVDRRRP